MAALKGIWAKLVSYFRFLFSSPTWHKKDEKKAEPKDDAEPPDAIYPMW